jgi:hypothetical protein
VRLFSEVDGSDEVPVERELPRDDCDLDLEDMERPEPLLRVAVVVAYVRSVYWLSDG